MRKYYATADTNNGVLEIFKNIEDAEKSLEELIEEGNKENLLLAEEYEEQGIDIPRAEDFYSIVEVDKNGNLL